MIVKRNINHDEEIVEFKNGHRLHFIYHYDNLAKMKEQLEDARTAYKNNPTLLNRLDMIYQAGDYMWANGEHEEAAEYLKVEIDGTEEVNNAPEVMIKWMDCNSLLAELLLRSNRPEEAIEYANVAMEVAENHFYDTIEYAYACELYGTALTANGEIDNAEEWYRDAKGRLKVEISEAERLLDCIDKNLERIEDFKDEHDSE